MAKTLEELWRIRSIVLNSIQNLIPSTKRFSIHTISQSLLGQFPISFFCLFTFHFLMRVACSVICPAARNDWIFVFLFESWSVYIIGFIFFEDHYQAVFLFLLFSSYCLSFELQIGNLSFKILCVDWGNAFVSHLICWG